MVLQPTGRKNIHTQTCSHFLAHPVSWMRQVTTDAKSGGNGLEGLDKGRSVDVLVLLNLCLCSLICAFIGNVYQCKEKVQLNCRPKWCVLVCFLPRQSRHFWMLGRFWLEAADRLTFLWLTTAPVRSPFVSLYNRDSWTRTLLILTLRRCQVVHSFATSLVADLHMIQCI